MRLWSIFFSHVVYWESENENNSEVTEWERVISIIYHNQHAIRRWECKNIDFVLVFDSDFRQFTIVDAVGGFSIAKYYDLPKVDSQISFWFIALLSIKFPQLIKLENYAKITFVFFLHSISVEKLSWTWNIF